MSPVVYVEFVSIPLGRTIAFEPQGTNGAQVVVGDVTGDGYPEIIIARSQWESAIASDNPEGIFYGHPLVFSWTDETFELLEVEWTGIPAHQLQGITAVMMITDVDQDAHNEIVVGTAPYHSATEKGAIYIFQWDEPRFVAEYADYCIGTVQRFDKIESISGIVASFVNYPIDVYPSSRLANLCPDVLLETSKLSSGLYALYAVAPDQYEGAVLVHDDDFLTAVSITEKFLDHTQFIRLQHISGNNRLLDWATMQWVDPTSANLASQYVTLLDIGRPIVQMEALNLDGDGIAEIVLLVANAQDDHNIALEDNLTWQVFQYQHSQYQLVYEGVADFSLQQGYNFKFFAGGDVDNDGVDEVLASNAEVYGWFDSQLVAEFNISEVMGYEFYYGLESLYVGNVHNDGENRIVFTARYSTPEMPCPKLCLPQMYVMRID